MALGGAAALGVTACDPVDGELNTSVVALTTDEMGTKELERQHADVAWLSCTASFQDRVTPSSGGPTEGALVDVDCQGETKDGKDITIKGTVHDVVDGACVRGNLTAKIEGKVWFRVDVLGNCESGNDNGNGNENGGQDGGQQPSNPPASYSTPCTETPAPPPEPTCTCLPGK
ncbi:hypothetical protein [Streptomyces kanamyceticus]|uniref:Uncharacterized protein n=1 Tax=Streptomyces kanamyceticus TaxID=1967 RepID=A0A5J6GKF8_STRKN|nr:hypothetical protein [Streptomyces kanamyceticus]QEU94445.1 hypothetical protein CP970_29255 [Streptomyces kanamyceticus]